MTTWTDADLARFGDAEEVRIAGMRRDGSLRTPSNRVGGAGSATGSTPAPSTDRTLRGSAASSSAIVDSSSAGRAAVDVDFVDE